MGDAALLLVGTRTSIQRAGRGRGIEPFWLTDGVARPADTVVPLTNPSFVVVNQRRDRVYCAHGDGSTVSSLAIDAATGAMQVTGEQPCGGTNPVHLEISPDERTLYVANHGVGSVGVVRLGETGAVAELIQTVVLTGTPGPDATNQPSSRPHGVLVTRSGNALLIADKGTDRLECFRLRQDGTLEDAPAGVSVLPPGSGPRHIVEHPVLPVVYSVDEMACTVTAHAFDLEAGVLEAFDAVSTVAPETSGRVVAAEIALDPTGRHLYASTRGSDTVVHIEVDPGTGGLGAADWTDTRGVCPRHFLAAFDRDELYVANEYSHTIEAFQIDDAGRLSHRTRLAEVGSPTCLVLL
ncbi:lactonase family protein [Pseudonocardia lutea]|uniref:Lactonase family protein n=1 Tax=Pseudonocardia lutea TaxID=2172015 RepID=A0ABW1IFZ8_9PSEU